MKHAFLALPLAAMLLALTTQQSAARNYLILYAPMPLLASAAETPVRSAYAPAPLPNQDIAQPRLASGQAPGEPAVAAGLTEARMGRTSSSLSNGSGFSDELTHHSRGLSSGLAPTVNLKMPIYWGSPPPQ